MIFKMRGKLGLLWVLLRVLLLVMTGTAAFVFVVIAMFWVFGELPMWHSSSKYDVTLYGDDGKVIGQWRSLGEVRSSSNTLEFVSAETKTKTMVRGTLIVSGIKSE